MLSYLIVTSDTVLMFANVYQYLNVQKFVFEDFFQSNQIAESCGYAKMFNGKYWEALKVMSNEYHKITL